MKELHIFYAPEIESTNELSPEDSAHAVRVLRMHEGDEITITDGKGHFLEGRITIASQKHCRVEITDRRKVEASWRGKINIAVAPTKSMDRIEWFAEKATEIGVDRITFLNCKNSERRIIKTERIEKIVVAAMKQSHKAWLPEIEGMTDFKTFIAQEFHGDKYIAHCYAESDIEPQNNLDDEKPSDKEAGLLWNECSEDGNTLVLIGPEGDFSIDEVREALAAGFKPISLGDSRLRTETAALAAVHIMNIKKN